MLFLKTSVTNAVQILSNTTDRDNLFINQVGILLKELCCPHALREPPDVEQLRTALDPLRLSRSASAVAQKMLVRDTKEID